jgi:8-oxo-dGTP pyrophosphatase MutT (NUDIX family)
MAIPDDRLRTALLALPAAWEDTTLRCAAVLLPLLPRPDGERVLFTVRPLDLPAHPGQISFPGGAREGDELPLQCALRETAEELGLDPGTVAPLGGLPARESSSGFLVHVIVARIRGAALLRPDPAEVERILEVPLRALRDESAWQARAVPRPGGGSYPESPHFALGADVVWGLTGRIAFDLVLALRGVDG